MKILLVVCLLASAYAAPAAKIKRNILPGDPRYNQHDHHHHHEHEHHENEIETSQALQSDFAGSVSVPDTSYGVFGATTGAPLGLSDYLKYNVEHSKSAINPDFVSIGGAKVVGQSQSVSESGHQVTTPKVISVSLVESSRVSEASTAAPGDSVEVPSQESGSNADHEAQKSTEEIEVETTSTGDDTSSDTHEAPVEPETVGSKASAAGSVSSNEAGLSPDSLSIPYQPSFDSGSSFDSGFNPSFAQSSFGSGFDSFDQSSFNPGFQSGLNTNYEFFRTADNVGYPVDLGSYSGFEQGHTVDSQFAASFPQFNPVEYSKNVEYLSPHSFNFQNGYSAPGTVTASPFPSLLSVTPAPADLKFSSEQSYLAPAGQDNIYRKWSPAPSLGLTSVTIEKSIEPEIKISESSSSGITQLTDANGGYIY